MTPRNLMHWVRIFCWVTLVPGLVAGGMVAFRSSHASKPLRKTGKSTFKCPDPRAAEGCRYFEGLVTARERNVSPYYDAAGFEYACFRDESDQFFTVHLSGPSELGERGADSQKAPKRRVSPPGEGEVTAFARGVKDATLAPQLRFKGTWLGVYYFVATEINGQSVSGSVAGSISADPQQFSASWRYKSPSGALVDYRLVIHASTGRFSETFAENPSRLPSLIKSGHCAPLP